MKKCFFCCFLFVMATTFLSAQSNCLIGLYGGVVNSYYLMPGGLKDAAERLPFYGPSFGVSFRHNLKGKSYLQAGLQYAKLGEKVVVADLKWGSETDGNGNYVRDPSLPHRLTMEQRTEYLSFRAGAGYYLLNAEKLRLGVMPFVEANVLLSNQNDRRFYFDDGSLDNIMASSTEDFPPTLRKFNTSAGLALSLEAKVSEKFDLFLAPEAAYQLQSAAVRNSPDTHHYLSVGLNLGVFYRL